MATKAGRMTMQIPQQPTPPSATPPAPGLRVRWDEAGVKSSYPTICNVESTREAVIVSFGLSQAGQAGQQEIPVQLTDRIILTPQSAQRLALLLVQVVREYEARFRAAPAPGARPAE
jgi:uncharacterized protein DUF3467